MGDEKHVYSLDDYRAERSADDEKVTCAKCGELIAAQSTQCPHCGIHFDGLACDFAPEERAYQPKSAVRLHPVIWVILALVAIVTVLAMLAVLLG